MSMLRTCSFPGCNTLTLGELCLEHEKVDLVPVVPEPAAPAAAAVTHEVPVEAATG